MTSPDVAGREMQPTVQPTVEEIYRPASALPLGPTPDYKPGENSVVIPSNESEPSGSAARFGSIFGTTWDDVRGDYGNYYTRDTLGKFALVMAPAAVLANSDLDMDVRDWYQHHVRTYNTNRVADVFRPLGNGYYTIPGYVALKFLGETFPDGPVLPILGDFGDRVTRAFIVGAPPLVAVQVLTGGSRPTEYEDRSFWKPFHDSRGASGHAFIGALPFITAAQMTDDPLAKAVLYAVSPWTGFSRINDDRHYLSQVWLGWWMAYFACDAVNKTQHEKQSYTVTPLVTPDMTGVGVIYQH